MTRSRVINDRYRLDRPLGQGGMGVVWEGYDRALRRPVAIKQLLPPQRLEPGQERELKARFLREARSAASLDHPSVISIYDVLEDPDGPWLVMRLIEEDGPLPADRVAEIGLALLDALECAHAEGVVHRDLKPGNVMVADDGGVVLTDFGIAAISNATHSLTQTGQLIGSLGYIAPERFSAGSVDGKSDLWSLGATLYFSAEGRRAFRADEGPEVHIARLLMGERPEFTRAAMLEPAIKGLLEKNPDKRLTIDQARRRLKAVDGETALPPTKAVPRFSPPRRAVIGIPALLLAMGALVAAAISHNAGQGEGRDPHRPTSPDPSAAVRFTTIPDVCGNLSGEMLLDDLIDYRRPSDSKTGADERKCGWETERSASVPVDARLSFTARKFPGAGQAEAYLEQERGKRSIFGGPGYADFGEPGETGDQALFRVWNENVEKTVGGEVYYSSNTTEIIFRESNLVIAVGYTRSRGDDPEPADTARTRQGAELITKKAASSLGG